MIICVTINPSKQTKEKYIMKQVFQADDGKVFETQAECEKYESKSELFDFVDSNIEASYNDDAGYHIIETQNVVDFIEAHYEKIGELLGKVKVEDDCWIINTKTTDGRPSTLKVDDCIEVEYANGERVRCLAIAWTALWNTKNHMRHIAKYRKVN
jgi:hypothetical protein